MTVTIPSASEVEETIQQVVDSLDLPQSVAEVSDWSETPSGQCFMEFTAPSPTWAHTIASSALGLFSSRGQDVEIYTDLSIITIQVTPDFCE